MINSIFNDKDADIISSNRQLLNIDTKMAHTLENGTILDNRYRIERMIGAGGMGHVYEARHLLIGRNVAVKTLHRLETVDDRAIRRI